MLKHVATLDDTRRNCANCFLPKMPKQLATKVLFVNTCLKTIVTTNPNDHWTLFGDILDPEKLHRLRFSGNEQISTRPLVKKTWCHHNSQATRPKCHAVRPFFLGDPDSKSLLGAEEVPRPCRCRCHRNEGSEWWGSFWIAG